jgi:hypothetical protein
VKNLDHLFYALIAFYAVLYFWSLTLCHVKKPWLFLFLYNAGLAFLALSICVAGYVAFYRVPQ